MCKHFLNCSIYCRSGTAIGKRETGKRKRRGRKLKKKDEEKEEINGSIKLETTNTPTKY
jgi:hypothetical protein